MKKLLALLLCVMLLVSVVPTAAFAGPATEQAMKNLYEKFYGQGYNGLPMAYAKLGGAYVYANAINGTTMLLKALEITGEDAETIIDGLKSALGGSMEVFLNRIYYPLLSPAALFAIAGPKLVDMMDEVGAAVAANTEDVVDKKIEGVRDAINNIAVGLGEEAPFGLT